MHMHTGRGAGHQMRVLSSEMGPSRRIRIAAGVTDGVVIVTLRLHSCGWVIQTLVCVTQYVVNKGLCQEIGGDLPNSGI